MAIWYTILQNNATPTNCRDETLYWITSPLQTKEQNHSDLLSRFLWSVQQNRIPTAIYSLLITATEIDEK